MESVVGEHHKPREVVPWYFIFLCIPSGVFHKAQSGDCRFQSYMGVWLSPTLHQMNQNLYTWDPTICMFNKPLYLTKSPGDSSALLSLRTTALENNETHVYCVSVSSGATC